MEARGRRYVLGHYTRAAQNERLVGLVEELAAR